MQLSRRDMARFALTATPLARAFGAKKINSKFNGVQIGAITYSFNRIASPDPEAIIKAYVEIGLGEAELMSNHCEALAGAPPMPMFRRLPGPVLTTGTNKAPFRRPQLTPEQEAERKAAMEKLASWRASTTPATWKGVANKFSDAGIDLALLCYNMQDSMKDDDIEYGFQMAKALGVRGITTSTTLTMAKRIAPIADRHKLLVGYHGHDATNDPNQTATLESYATLMAYGKYNGVDIRAESRYDELSTTFTQPTLTVEHEFSDTFRAQVKLGRANSKFRNPVQTTTTLDALNVNGYALDFRGNDRLPVISYPFDVTSTSGPLQIVGVPVATSGTQATTVANATTSEIRIRPQGANNRNDVAQIDLTWEPTDNFLLKGGLQSKKYKFDTYEFRRINQNDTIFAPSSTAGLTTTLAGFGKGLSLPAGVPTAWVIPDLKAIVAAYDIYCNCLKSGPVGGPGDFTLSSTTNGNARGNNRAVQETDRGGYLMAEFSQRPFGIKVDGNVGVRYVDRKSGV